MLNSIIRLVKHSFVNHSSRLVRYCANQPSSTFCLVFFAISFNTVFVQNHSNITSSVLFSYSVTQECKTLPKNGKACPVSKAIALLTKAIEHISYLFDCFRFSVSCLTKLVSPKQIYKVYKVQFHFELG